MVAYTWDSIGWFWTNHYIFFCPLFFKLDKDYDLAKLIKGANGKPWKQKVLENFDYSPGLTYFHETYHVRTILLGVDSLTDHSNIFLPLFSGRTQCANRRQTLLIKIIRKYTDHRQSII